MSGVSELYREFRHGLGTAPGPEDPLFEDVWGLYLDVTNLVAARLTEPQMGGGMGAADRVGVFLAWADPSRRLCQGMPLRVPSPAYRSLKATGRYLERTLHLGELGEFLRLASPFVNDFSGYATDQLGRQARPVRDELSFTARAGALMAESVNRMVPGIDD